MRHEARIISFAAPGTHCSSMHLLIHEELLISNEDKEGAWFLFQVTVDIDWSILPELLYTFEGLQEATFVSAKAGLQGWLLICPL